MTFLETEEIQRIGDAIGLKGRFLVDWGTDDIINTLCPKPEFETAEVKRWACVRDDKIIDTARDKRKLQEIYRREGDFFIELTGTYHREVKPKVKHREQVFGFEGHFAGGSTFKFSGKYKIFAEWEE